MIEPANDLSGYPSHSERHVKAKHTAICFGLLGLCNVYGYCMALLWFCMAVIMVCYAMVWYGMVWYGIIANGISLNTNQIMDNYKYKLMCMCKIYLLVFYFFLVGYYFIKIVVVLLWRNILPHSLCPVMFSCY